MSCSCIEHNFDDFTWYLLYIGLCRDHDFSSICIAQLYWAQLYMCVELEQLFVCLSRQLTFEKSRRSVLDRSHGTSSAMWRTRQRGWTRLTVLSFCMAPSFALNPSAWQVQTHTQSSLCTFKYCFYFQLSFLCLSPVHFLCICLIFISKYNLSQYQKNLMKEFEFIIWQYLYLITCCFALSNVWWGDDHVGERVKLACGWHPEVPDTAPDREVNDTRGYTPYPKALATEGVVHLLITRFLMH